MPTYDLMLVLQPWCTRPNMLRVFKKVANEVLPGGGIIRRIDHMGLRHTAQKMRKHGRVEREGRFVRFQFESNSQVPQRLNKILRVDEQVFKWTTLSVKAKRGWETPDSVFHPDRPDQGKNFVGDMVRFLPGNFKIENLTPDEIASLPAGEKARLEAQAAEDRAKLYTLSREEVARKEILGDGTWRGPTKELSNSMGATIAHEPLITDFPHQKELQRLQFDAKEYGLQNWAKKYQTLTAENREDLPYEEIHTQLNPVAATRSASQLDNPFSGQAYLKSRHTDSFEKQDQGLFEPAWKKRVHDEVTVQVKQKLAESGDDRYTWQDEEQEWEQILDGLDQPPSIAPTGSVPSEQLS